MTVTNAEAHRIAREKGVSGPLYLLVKYTASLIFRLLCGFTASGKENVPKKGPVVIVPNHVCPTVNLYDELSVVEDGQVVDTWPVAARGRNG